MAFTAIEMLCMYTKFLSAEQALAQLKSRPMFLVQRSTTIQ